MEEYSNKKTILQVDQPCDESWDKMLPVVQGRHCSTCNRKVVDFAEMEDADILALLGEHQNERVCGRFRPSQLGRTMTTNRLSSFVEQTFSLRAVLLGASLSGLLALESCDPARKSVTEAPTEQPVPAKKDQYGKYDHSATKYISGTLLYPDGKVAKNAEVLLFYREGKGSGLVTTDRKGMFQFPVDEGLTPTSITVELEDDYNYRSYYASVDLDTVPVLQGMTVRLEELFIIGKVIRNDDLDQNKKAMN